MRNLANLTHGQYFYAGSGTDLKKVYEALQSRLVFEKKATGITALLSSGLLMLIATALSLWWFGRIA